MLLPVIYFVIAEDDLAETRTVDLDARIAFVTFDRFGAAENLGALTATDHFGAHLTRAGIDADRLARHAGSEERRRHPIRRPGLLRTRFEHQPDLQRNHRHPERVHA